MPRPLHDDVDYRNALGVLGAMAGFEMNGDQEDYFEAIATFVEKYETENHSLDGKQAWALVQPRRGACALATGASPWKACGGRSRFCCLLWSPGGAIVRWFSRPAGAQRKKNLVCGAVRTTGLRPWLEGSRPAGAQKKKEEPETRIDADHELTLVATVLRTSGTLKELTMAIAA